MTAIFRTSQIVSDTDVGKPHLILVGLPGSGKTVAGEALAAHLNRSFLDFDREIERRESASISELFAIRGEPYFRDVHAVPDPGQARREALALAGPRGAVVVTGSLYLLAELSGSGDRP